MVTLPGGVKGRLFSTREASKTPHQQKSVMISQSATITIILIDLREKALMMVENQCADYQDTLEKLEEARDEAQAEKDAKVGKHLKKLHVSENERFEDFFFRN